MQRRRLVRVPASSANLGPGFDAFAAALGLHLELEVVETGRFAVETDLPIARDARNLAVRGFAALADPAAFTFRIRSEIPLAGGFGTSAAAYVAGLMAADHLFELDADVLALANALEGHPDNAAAACTAGSSWWPTDGPVARFDPPTGLEAVAVVPHSRCAPKQARAAMPAEVPWPDAVFNVAHAALLVPRAGRGDWDLVARGLDDRLHQPRREHLFPRSMELVRRRALGALGATISGAGPSVLVWCHFEQTAGVFDGLRREPDGWARVVRAPFETQGADVRDLWEGGGRPAPRGGRRGVGGGGPGSGTAVGATPPAAP